AVHFCAGGTAARGPDDPASSLAPGGIPGDKDYSREGRYGPSAHRNMDVDLRAHEVHSLGFKIRKSHRVGLGGKYKLGRAAYGFGHQGQEIIDQGLDGSE